MIPFKPGDLVIAGGILKRVEQVLTSETTGADPVLMTSHGAEHPEDCQLVTVPVAFALAGFRINNESRLICGHSWMQVNECDYAVFVGPGEALPYFAKGGWDWRAIIPGEAPSYSRLGLNPSFNLPDLSSLPVRGAWSVLPAIVRERLEALIGQEVNTCQ